MIQGKDNKTECTNVSSSKDTDFEDSPSCTCDNTSIDVIKVTKNLSESFDQLYFKVNTTSKLNNTSIGLN